MKTTILLLSLIANLAAAVFIMPQLRDRIGGHHYDLSKREDVSLLRKLIYQSVPLQSAVEVYREAHGVCPPDDLTGVELPSSNYKAELLDAQVLHYVPSGDHYDLYIKLGLDPSLHYSSETKTWAYDTGDGRSESVITP